ncbi:MAG: macro domain-containing protein [Candidatus Obscuribacter sp.]|nr:macro domain-containing protein [Candidatus Obscuribacter sp.]
MIEIGHGNLLEADVEALVNTVNCVGIMGKGIALQFKQAYPDNFKAYEKACRSGEVCPGKMFIFRTNKLLNPKYIVNFPTKRHWKQPSSIVDIEVGLDALVADIESLGVKSIAVPPLGCGNGGLDWADVRPLVEKAFSKVPTVKVLVYEAKGAPSAEKMPIGTEKPQLTRPRALLIQLLELYGIPGYELTLLEVQKLAYFLQAAGEPLRLRFEKEKFGPYAHNLNHVLQKLEGHFIRGYGDHAAVDTQVHTLPGAAEEATSVLASLPEALERLARVGRLICGFETPYGMELLATVHWLVTNEDAHAAENVERAIRGVQSWSRRKAGLFRDEHIKAAWLQLREQGWLQPTSTSVGAR